MVYYLLVLTILGSHNIVKPSCRGMTTDQIQIPQEEAWVGKVYSSLLLQLKHCLKEVELPDKVGGVGIVEKESE